ncbi:MAG: FAD-dependent oxidoreductase [Clostridia bacterium]|nr:FAD-dependent oxidoreductase [Deltaproteobacteria bacterium]
MFSASTSGGHRNIYEAVDGSPYVGRTHGHTYVATGFSGDGLPFSVIAARLLSESTMDRPSAEADIFSPKRMKPIAGAKKLVQENMDVAAHMIADRLTAAQSSSLADTAPGEGRLVQLGMRKLADYRSPEGELSVLSATCTHLKCIVYWNQAESSWDCPCHGRRFDVRGQPIEGPPVTPLARMANPSDTQS